MNRKTSRYLLPLVLVFGLLFAAVASADPLAPTSQIEVDVNFEHSNSEAVDITFTGTNNQGFASEPPQNPYTATDTSHSSAEDNFAAGTFYQGDYEIVADTDDTLPFLLTTNINFATGTVVLGPLTEGDIDDDNLVGLSDIGFVRNNFGNGAGDDADLDEDDLVGLTDVGFVRVNFGEQYDDGSRSANRGVDGTSSIRWNPTGYASATDQQILRFDVFVDNPGGAENINAVQIHVDYDETELSYVTARVGANDGIGGGCQAGNCDFENIDVTQTTPGQVGNTTVEAGQLFFAFSSNELESGEAIKVAELYFRAEGGFGADDLHEGVIFLDGDSTPGTQSGTIYVIDDGTRVPVGRDFANCAPAGCGTGFLTVGLSEFGTQQTVVTTIVALIAVLGVATLVVTRKARQD